MIRRKRGVSTKGNCPEILNAAIDCAPIFEKYRDIRENKPSADLVITSGSERIKHSARHSDHYGEYNVRGQDWRINHIVKSKRAEVVRKIKRKLGPDFFVFHEAIGKPYEHIHLGYRPIYAP